MRMSIAFLLAMLAPSIASAQRFSVGVAAGVPLDPLASAGGNVVSATGRYTFGLSLEAAVTRAVGVDIELLYKRFDIGSVSGPARIGVHRLELPVLVRYRFRHRSATPFAHAGMSFNLTMPSGGAGPCPWTGSAKGFYCIGHQTVAQLRHRHTHGVVLGAGFEFGPGSLRFAPELRVTRWVDRNFGTRDSPLRSNLTQVELLFGLKF